MLVKLLEHKKTHLFLDAFNTHNKLQNGLGMA